MNQINWAQREGEGREMKVPRNQERPPNLEYPQTHCRSLVQITGVCKLACRPDPHAACLYQRAKHYFTLEHLCMYVIIATIPLNPN